ncbi:hypothetical protein MC885_015986 [Smutsia gigantea]|nr:hypothetical protein MC885_015986 [Smutsia gigantea]
MRCGAAQSRVTNGDCGPVTAASVSSLSESLPAQCTEGGVPGAPSAPDSTSPAGQSSPVSNQSLLSESVASSQVDSSSVDKAIPETEDLPGLHMNQHLFVINSILEHQRPSTILDACRPRAEGLFPLECDPP